MIILHDNITIMLNPFSSLRFVVNNKINESITEFTKGHKQESANRLYQALQAIELACVQIRNENSQADGSQFKANENYSMCKLTELMQNTRDLDILAELHYARE